MKHRNKKNSSKRQDFSAFDSDEHFAYIAGYTSGGAAYGITREEMEDLSQEGQTPVVDLLERQLQAFIEERRPPEEKREKVDLGYSYQNNTVEIFEIRPQWNDRTIKREHKVAKAQYIKSRNIWKIYWMPSTLQWTAYQPEPEVKDIQQFLAIVDQDAHHCFFG